MALGIDYWQFDRFEKLTPTRVYYIDGHVEVREPPGYAPSQEEFELCRQFVITAALRMAEAEAHVVSRRGGRNSPEISPRILRGQP